MLAKVTAAAVGLARFPRGCGAHRGLACAVANPVIAVFPTTLPDGSPLVKRIEDVLELHTVIDGRKVTLTFDLKHLEVKSVDDCSSAPPGRSGARADDV